jgi:hypothetical protein
MGRINSASNPDIQPVAASGTAAATKHSSGEGWVLAANGIYYYALAIEEADLFAVQISSFAAGVIISSAYVEDSTHKNALLTDATASLRWVKEEPGTAYVAASGASWSTNLATAAASGAGAGSAIWHLSLGSSKARLRVAVGGTGGQILVSSSGKGGH